MTPHDPRHVLLKIRQALSGSSRSKTIPLLPTFDYAIQPTQSTTHEKPEANSATETATPSPQPSSRSSPQRQQAITTSPLSAKFVDDVTIPDGLEMQPSQRFLKTWKVKNNGQARWPDGCSLIFTGGDILRPYPSPVQHNGLIPSLSPDEEARIDVELSAPEMPGHHVSFFRIISPEGIRFGDGLWCDINVVSSLSIASTTPPNSSSSIQDPSDSSYRNVTLTTPTEPSVSTMSVAASSHEGTTDYGDHSDDNSSNPWISESRSIGSQTETSKNQRHPGYISVTPDSSTPNEKSTSPLSATSQDYEWVIDHDRKFAGELARLHELVSGNTNVKIEHIHIDCIPFWIGHHLL